MRRVGKHHELISKPTEKHAMGKVYLVGAGPGDPELLALKAARVLSQANVVLHDSLVSGGVLAMISSKAEIVDVGKRSGTKLLTQDEINALLVHYASNHDVVVRLKGGDPLIFGRAAEEIEALQSARVAYEIVPGITAALGAAAAAGISLTDRRLASQVLLTTFSHGPGSCGQEWNAINNATTMAIYMPGRDYAALATRLIDKGLSGDTPCAVVSHATSAEQKIKWLSVEELYEASRLPAPALVIVGRIAARKAKELRRDFFLEERHTTTPLASGSGIWNRN
jgi:uroporphyrin-III C-methyltransferase